MNIMQNTRYAVTILRLVTDIIITNQTLSLQISINLLFPLNFFFPPSDNNAIVLTNEFAWVIFLLLHFAPRML